MERYLNKLNRCTRIIMSMIIVLLLQTQFTRPLNSQTIHSNHYELKGNELVLSSGIIGGTSLFFLLDETVRDFAINNQGSAGDFLFSITNEFGEFHTNLGIAGALYVGGLITNDVNTEKTGLLVAESMVVSSLVTHTLKIIFGRSRPNMNRGNTDFHFFEFSDDYHSLPSGHSTLAFSTATVIAGMIDRPYAYISAYTLAALTMAARIYYDQHWLSDTFLGASIGIISGLIIVNIEKDRQEDKKDDKAMNIPVNVKLIDFKIPF